MNSILSQEAKPKETFREVPLELLNRFPFARWAPIPLRLIVGYGFMVHGFAKLARGPDAFAIVLCALGVPASHFMAWATILTEVLGGAAVILGAPLSWVVLAQWRSMASSESGVKLGIHRPVRRSIAASVTSRMTALGCPVTLPYIKSASHALSRRGNSYSSRVGR